MIIENLYLYLTWRCNLHCKHCWVSADAENLLNSCEIPDEKYKDISSIELLKHVGKLLEQHNYIIGNIDATIIAQRPKMAPHIPDMRKNIANALNISLDQINVKATTEEGLGFTGEGLGISSQAICLIQNKN